MNNHTVRVSVLHLEPYDRYCTARTLKHSGEEQVDVEKQVALEKLIVFDTNFANLLN